MSENKVLFGLKNVHYALVGTDTQGNITYGAPVAIPGAVSLALEAQGDSNKFYADNMAYYVSQTNDGYEGDLEIARIPDSMLTDVFKQSLDSTSKVLFEDNEVEVAAFALLFQIDGDNDDECYVLYNCKASRPQIGSSTVSDSKEPQTQTLTITASPRADGYIRARTTKDTGSSIRSGWFSSVQQPPSGN